MAVSTSNNIEVLEVKLSEIRRNPDQPRKQFDETSLNELANSIERYGLLNPITIARDPGGVGFIIVAGERRFRAHQILRKETILATVTSGKLEEKALIENIQRDELNPIEEAAALARLQESGGYTQAELSEVVGKARSTISNILGINKLPFVIKQEAAELGLANKSILIEISKLETEEEQLRHWNLLKRNVGPQTVRTTRKERAKKPKSTYSKVLRAELAEKLVEYFERSGLARFEAAQITNSSEPRISLLYQRDIEKFSIDALVDMLHAAGLTVDINVDPPSPTH